MFSVTVINSQFYSRFCFEFTFRFIWCIQNIFWREKNASNFVAHESHCICIVLHCIVSICHVCMYLKGRIIEYILVYNCWYLIFSSFLYLFRCKYAWVFVLTKLIPNLWCTHTQLDGICLLKCIWLQCVAETILGSFFYQRHRCLWYSRHKYINIHPNFSTSIHMFIVDMLTANMPHRLSLYVYIYHNF